MPRVHDVLNRQYDGEDGEQQQNDGNTTNRGCDWHTALASFMGPCEKDTIKDISRQAVWSLSSCKCDGDGFGVHELLSDDYERYWQSDGPQPHMVTIEFPRKTDISFVAIYLDFKADESYTPQKVVIRLGSSLLHMDTHRDIVFNDPNGWKIVDVRTDARQPARAFIVQLQVVQNHQNGRDTHIRHMRILGPSKTRFDLEARTLTTSTMRLPSSKDVENRQPSNSVDTSLEPEWAMINAGIKNMSVIR